MDAVNFLEESRRMCLQYSECKGCPANFSSDGCAVSVVEDFDAADAVSIVEKWLKEQQECEMA